MKKLTSFFTFLVLFAVIAVVPMLAGCAKTCAVNISIDGASRNGVGGWITHNYIAVYGTSTIQEGKNYEVAIYPSDGHKLESITINGEEYDKPINPAGMDLSYKVEGDTEIVVKFVPYEYNFKIFASKYSGDGTLFTGFERYDGYAVTGRYGDTILCYSGLSDVLNPANFTEAARAEYEKNGGIFYIEIGGTIKYINHTQGLAVRNGSYEFKTNLTKEQLDELFLPVFGITIEDRTDYTDVAEADEPFGTISVGGEAIEGSETFFLKQDKQILFNVVAKDGYVIDKIYIDGEEYVGFEPNSKQFGFALTVKKARTYSVTFKADEPLNNG